MKKIILIPVLLMFTTAVFAQGVSFGPRVGMNLSKVTNIKSDIKLGLNVGAFFTGYFTPHFGIEVAAMFSQEGAKREIETPSLGSVAVKTRLNYLNIPVVVKYRIIGGLNVFVGPQFGVMLSAKDVTKKITVNVTDAYRNTNISGVAGVGYKFNGGFDINFNYNFTMSKLRKEGEFSNIIGDLTGVSSLPSVGGGVWQLTLGYAF